MYTRAAICERGLRGPSLRGASRPRHGRCPYRPLRDAHCNLLYDGCNGLLPRSFGALHLRCISRARNPKPSSTAALSFHQRHDAGYFHAHSLSIVQFTTPMAIRNLGRGGYCDRAVGELRLSRRRLRRQRSGRKSRHSLHVQQHSASSCVLPFVSHLPPRRTSAVTAGKGCGSLRRVPLLDRCARAVVHPSVLPVPHVPHVPFRWPRGSHGPSSCAIDIMSSLHYFYSISNFSSGTVEQWNTPWLARFRQYHVTLEPAMLSASSEHRVLHHNHHAIRHAGAQALCRSIFTAVPADILATPH